jgi:hypothetical protein
VLYELRPDDDFREALPLAVYLRATFGSGRGSFRRHEAGKPNYGRGTPLEHVSWTELEREFRDAAERADGSWVEVTSEGGGVRIAGPTDRRQPRVQIPWETNEQVGHLERCARLEREPVPEYLVLRDQLAERGAPLPALEGDTHRVDWWAVDRTLRTLAAEPEGRVLLEELDLVPPPLARRFLDRWGRNCRAEAVWLTGPHGRYAAYRVLPGEAEGYYDGEPTFLNLARGFVRLSELEGPHSVELAIEESSDHWRIR